MKQSEIKIQTMHTSRTRVEMYMPGWVFFGDITSEPEGSLVVVHSEKASCVARTVWIANDGTVTDAHVNSLGYVVSESGIRLA